MNKWIGMAVLCAGCAMAWAAPVVERVAYYTERIEHPDLR